MWSLLDLGVWTDDRNSTRNALFLSQGSLSLPDASYYTDNGLVAQYKEAYLTHLQKMLALLDRDGHAPGADDDDGADGAWYVGYRTAAEGVWSLERRLAEAHVPNSWFRDPERSYTVVSPAELTLRTPDLPWDEFLATALFVTAADIPVDAPGVPRALDAAQIILQTPAYLPALEAALRETPGDVRRPPPTVTGRGRDRKGEERRGRERNGVKGRGRDRNGLS